MSDCLHCGTPNPSTSDQFCCSGCEFVYKTLQSEGLDRFYDLKGKAAGMPVRDRPFQPQDLAWLENALAATEGHSAPTTLTTSVQGVTCIGCVWLIEKLYLQLPGATHCALFPDTGEATFSWQGETSPLRELAESLPRYGYALTPIDASKKPPRESRRVLARLGLTSAFSLNAMAFTLPRYLGMSPDFAFAGLFELVTLISAIFALLLGGSYFFARALAALRQDTIHIDLPISLGLILAFLGSLAGLFLGEEQLLYFDFVAIFTTLVLAGRYFHLAASERARANLSTTSALPESTVLQDNLEKATSALAVGDRLLIPSGKPLPVTSFLEEENASFSLAWINGEPEPRHYQRGQRVPSGAINLGQHPASLTADEAFSDSLVAKLTQPAQRSETSALLQRILKVYLITVLALGIGGAIAWMAVGHDLVKALQVAISIFVVSCPCAIGVAIPMSDRRAASRLQALGVFVQDVTFWHRLTEIRNVILDKTGTLTLENPTLINPEALTTLTPEERSILLHLTAQSLHPLSRTLHQQLASATITPQRPSPGPTVSETAGQGLTCLTNGKTYTLGKAPSHRAAATSGPQSTFASDGQALAVFHFEESARPDATRSLSRLRLPIHILSGDESIRVKTLAKNLHLDSHLALGDLSPEDKAVATRRLNPALFLGDGANDSLAFDAALVTGSPVADRSLLDSKADFLFTQTSLTFLPHLLTTARWRRSTVRRILTFTILYNISAISLCLSGYMNPLLASILMPLSSLLSLLIASNPITRAQASGDTLEAPSPSISSPPSLPDFPPATRSPSLEHP